MGFTLRLSNLLNDFQSVNYILPYSYSLNLHTEVSDMRTTVNTITDFETRLGTHIWNTCRSYDKFVTVTPNVTCIVFYYSFSFTTRNTFPQRTQIPTNQTNRYTRCKQNLYSKIYNFPFWFPKIFFRLNDLIKFLLVINVRCWSFMSFRTYIPVCIIFIEIRTTGKKKYNISINLGFRRPIVY